MNIKYKIGEILYYPLRDEILKSRLAKITIHKDIVWYELECGRSNSEQYFFTSFEDARQFCLDEELKKYQEAVKKIREWHE